MLARVSRFSAVAGKFCAPQRLASTFVQKFDEATTAIPMKSAVKYNSKNVKWTAGELKDTVESHANALLEHNFSSGEVVALWLPEGPEKHVTMLAAAKAGLRIVDVDASISSVADVRQFLTMAKCKALFFEPESETNNNLLTLRKSIPEFYEYDDSYGQPFHSKHWPSLEYFVHTGFDIELGCLNYKGLFLPHPQVNKVAQLASTLSDDMPLYTRITKGDDGALQASSMITHGQAVGDKNWTFASKVINKEYFEQP